MRMMGEKLLIVAVSGPIAVGKSAFIAKLVDDHHATRVSTRELILSLLEVPSERKALRDAGDSLDRETDGKWVASALSDILNTLGIGLVVVDSVRTKKQVEHLRCVFAERVMHVHLTASHSELSRRFENRKREGDRAVREFSTYDESRGNTTEADIEQLGDIADVRIETDGLSVDTIVARVTGRMAALL